MTVVTTTTHATNLNHHHNPRRTTRIDAHVKPAPLRETTTHTHYTIRNARCHALPTPSHDKPQPRQRPLRRLLQLIASLQPCPPPSPALSPLLHRALHHLQRPTVPRIERHQLRAVDPKRLQAGTLANPQRHERLRGIECDGGEHGAAVGVHFLQIGVCGEVQAGERLAATQVEGG